MLLASEDLTAHGRYDLVPQWMVRGQYTWGRAVKLSEAIKLGNFAPGDEVYVCRVDDKASCDCIAGNLSFDNRTPIWKGKVTRNGKDVRLIACTHPGYRAGEKRAEENWPDDAEKAD